MRKYIAPLFGMLLTAIASTGVTPASWALFHTEEVPQSLKK